ncbi:MAG TPA: hypothetical protein VGD23_06765, partial [Sphingomicrobium sp.]
MRKSMWLLSAGLAALSMPVYAQENTATQEDATTPSDAATAEAPSPTEAAATDDSDVIVVTAQGRRQILQDVPIAVTAVNADAMQNSGAND